MGGIDICDACGQPYRMSKVHTCKTVMTEQPRSTRAVSADGTWAAELVDGWKGGVPYWIIRDKLPHATESTIWDVIDDTGQDAADVLSLWESEQEARNEAS